jgi:hypothetical protein
MSLHMEVCWQPTSAQNSNTYQPLIKDRIQWLRYVLERYKGKTLATFSGCVRAREASQEHGCCCERVREHTRTPQLSEKRVRRRRGDLYPDF